MYSVFDKFNVGSIHLVPNNETFLVSSGDKVLCDIKRSNHNDFNE